MKSFYVIFGNILSICYTLSDARRDNRVCSEDTIFINHHQFPSASGWYTQDKPSCIYVKSSPPNSQFNYLEEDDVWKLLFIDSGPDGTTMKTLFNTTKNIASLFRTKPTNLKSVKRDTLRLPNPRSQYSEKKGSLSMSRFSNRNRSRRQDLLHSHWSQESSEELSNEISLSPEPPKMHESQESFSNEELKIYYSKRCSCTKLEIQYNGAPFTEFFRVDTNKNLLNRCNLTSIDESSNDTNTYQWQPESYVSEHCQLLEYHASDDTWWVELSQYCSPTQRGIYMIWSNDPAPCVEYLPPPRRQVWMYYRRQTVFDIPFSYDSLYIENCGGFFKKSIYENFTIECVSMEEEDS